MWEKREGRVGRGRKGRYACIGGQGESCGEGDVLWYGRRELRLRSLTD